MDAYRQAVERLYDLQKFGIKLGLNSTELLLKRLGDPHLDVPTIHLAGTNGKGSVGAMLEACLMDAGVKTGFYTSPHLVNFTERFKINSKEISRDAIVSLAEDVWAVTDDREPPTFFEFVTAMGFLYFARQKVDLLILETGLGGRLDATNVTTPLATVITNIGLEHQEFLGNTLAEVAYEKAGIIKPYVPIVHGITQPAAREVVEMRAGQLGAPVIRLGRDVRFRRKGSGESFSLWGRTWRFGDLRTNLRGAHQPSNAALALGAAEALVDAGVAIGPDNFASGLNKVDWPARLEQWPTAQGEPTLWLDGAHNVPAAKALVASMEQIRRPGGPLVMVVGVMADKAIADILAILLPLADKVVFSRPMYIRAADPRVLADAAPDACPPYEIIGELGPAMDRAKQLAGPDGVVLVSGSLFTVGEARAILGGMDTSDLL